MGLMSGYLNLRSGLLACSVSVLFNIGLLMCTHPIGKKYTIITMIATLPSAIILPQLMWFYSPIMAGVLGGVYMIAIHQLFLIKDSL